MLQTTGLRDIPEQELWRRDLYLRRLEPLIDSVRLISLDVFDTLLLRCTARPADVFESAAAKAIERGIIRRPTAAAEFRTMRVAAERLARERDETGSGEVTLEQIYACLPASLGDRDELLQIELEAEREACFVNPSIASLIRYCRSRNIRVALLSDMYLSAAQLVSLLTAGGLEAGLTDAVLVSSEAGCGKRSGELFDVLMRRFPDISADRIVHIGDNETADVLGAAKRDIEAIHYAVIPDTIDSPFHWEMVRHGDLLPEVAAIRKLAVATDISGTGVSEPFFYRFGAGMLGPFIQGFCDWVLDMCAAENRSEIHPLMREAVLLGPALRQAALLRGMTVAIKPLYVSRQATLLASMRDFTGRELERITGLGSITLGEAADMLGIRAEQVPGPLNGLLHVSAAEARRSRIRQTSEFPKLPGQPEPAGDSLYDAFKRFMLLEPIAKQARATIAKQRKLLLDYIRQACDCPDQLLTVDLGFNGTIQAAIDAAYANDGAAHDSIHLLAVGTERSAERILQGTDVRCWIGGGADNGDLAKRFARSPGLIEELMMGEFGSTVRYERREDGRIKPVLADLAIPEEQFRYKAACREGVFAFQSYYGHLRHIKPHMARNADARQWCGIMHRVLDMPTPEEAAALGDLVHQDNFGGVQTIRLCEPIPVEWQSRGGDYLIDLSAFGPKTADVFWPQGLVTRHEPYRLYKTYLRLSDSFGSAVLAFNAVTGLKRAGLASAIVYGNGDFAHKLAHEALLHGVRIERMIEPASASDLFDGFADAASKDGRRCPTALEDAIATGPDTGHVYLIATLNDIEEYKRTISDAYRRLRPDVVPLLFEPFA